MKCLILYHSYHHNNTKKIADAMAVATGALARTTEEVKVEALVQYDVIGFGAGIDSGRHYQQLLDFAQGLPHATGKRCFLFSTSAVQGESKVAKDHACLRKILLAKGYQILGEFSCKGYNTNSFLKYLGGMNKERPNAEDVRKAKEFAQRMVAAS